MPTFGRKLLICSAAFTFCFSAVLTAQDSTAAAADSVPADTSSAAAAPGDSTVVSSVAADSAAAQASTADTAAVAPGDSTVVSPVTADSAAAQASTADTAAAGLQPDSLKPASKEAAPPAPSRPRPSGTEVEALVIAWDWDDFTNVIEVGLKRIRDERVYSLAKNEEYQRLFDRFQGKKVRVWGRISREGEGFYSLTINEFEPLDSLNATANQPGPKR